MMKKLFLAALIPMLFTGLGFAANNNSGPDILRVSDTAPMIALGGIGMASGRAADGLYSNPSYLLNAQCLEISGNHLIWMEDYNWEYLNAVYPSSAGDFGLGLFLYHQPQDDYVNPVGIKTGQVLGKSDMGISLSYCHILLKVPMGLTVKYISHQLVDKSANSILFDFGLHKGFFVGEGVLAFALGVRNLGSSSAFISETMNMPFQVPVELGYKISFGSTAIGVFGGMNIFASGDLTGGLGIELGFFDKYKLRVGNRFGSDMLGLSLGAGIEQNFKNVDLQLDYGLIFGNGLGAVHSIQVTAKLWSVGELGDTTTYMEKLNLDPFLKFIRSDTNVKIKDESKELESSGIQVKIDSAEASSADSPAEYAFDNNQNTRWASEGGKDPQWIIFTLVKSKVLRGMKIRWEAAAGKRYDILVSMDGTEWQTVARIDNGESNQERIILFDKPTKAKYVKVYGKERAGNWGYSIWEVLIYE
jgi:hypothetical protein